MTAYDPGTQAERRTIIKEEARLRPGDRPPTTYHQLSQRPQAEDLPKSDVSPLHYPAQPASSPWSSDPVPAEPPLGYAIDDIGEALGGASS
jgi:hypothetical protein